MDIFDGLIGALAALPDWIGFLLPPALLAASAGIPRGKRRGLRHMLVAFAAGGLGVFLLAGKGAATVCAFTGLFCVWAAALFPLAVRRKKERVPMAAERTDIAPAAFPRPPKVCHFEEGELVSAAQCGMRLKHAETLLVRLKEAGLTASDRLETDVLTRTVSALSGRPLSAAERETLNDCLTATLKLTAKYQL